MKTIQQPRMYSLRIDLNHLSMVLYLSIKQIKNPQKIKVVTQKDDAYFGKIQQNSRVAFWHTECLTYSFNRGIVRFSKRCLTMTRNGIFILASFANTLKLIRRFDRLIRPKLDWLNQKYFQVSVHSSLLFSTPVSFKTQL